MATNTIGALEGVRDALIAHQSILDKIDRLSPDEREAFEWLRQHPDLLKPRGKGRSSHR